MRKHFVILGSAIFFVVIVSMYMMLDQTKFSQDFPGQSAALTGEELNQLANKIQVLENDLNDNHQTINQLRDAVRLLAKGDTEFQLPGVVPMNQKKVEGHREETGPLKVAEIKADGAVAQVDEGECSFGNTPSGTDVDVQMLDVYEHLKFDNPNGGVWKQGFEITYDAQQWKDDPLQVILVPHSHNDPGWIKTVDKYYNDQTQHILNNAVSKLQEHEHMKLIWAEISFFSMWWEKTDRRKREEAKRLIEKGKLEIVTGGWVMNDEANTHYYAMIDQMIEGHEWLENFIGVKPKHGWAIDPFGMSPTMAYILQRMGFEAMVIQRVHYSVKKYLAQEKKLEFMWRQNWDHGSTTDMFCHLMPFYSYDIPHTCGPDPKVCCQFDFKRLPGGRISCPWKVPPVVITDGNVEAKAKLLLDQYRKKASLYKSNVLLVPLGDDFRYDKAIEWDQQYTNYQKLIDYMNSREDWFVKARIGTLDDYFSAVFQRTRSPASNQPQGFPVLGGDFFTYTDRDDHYWSGYYTSRPFYKSLDRVLESQLRAAEIAFTLAATSARQSGANQFEEDDLVVAMTYARRMLGLFQHHDGITGTAKDHVVVDYATRMLRALNDIQKVLMQSVHYLMTADKPSFIPQATFFDVDEERKAHDSIPEKKILKLSDEEAPSIVVFYNSLAHDRRELVHLKVSSANIQVMDDDNNIIPSQSNLVWTSQTDSSQTDYELVFVVEMAPVSMKKYLVKDMGSSKSEAHHLPTIEMYHTGIDETENRGPFEVKRSRGDSPDFLIENAFLTAKFSGSNGLLQSITTKEDNKETDMSIEFMTYGTTSGKSKSGAYLFMPDRDAQPVNLGRPNMRIIKGPLLSEVHVFTPFAEHKVLLPNTPGVDSTSLSITNIVDIRTERNKELVMRIKTGVQNKDGNFYTDINAFQMQRRKYYAKLPLQANFYPMTSMAFLEDETSRITVHTAQPLGVASLKTGWIEVVLDRRLMQDDNRGVQQGVTDNKRTPSHFRLQLERRHGSSAQDGANKQQDTAPPTSYPSLLSHYTTHTLNHPLILYTALPEGLDAASKLLPEFNGLGASLPCDMHLLNLRTRVLLDDKSIHAKREALLLLHRKGFDCSFPGTSLTCSTNEGKVSASDLFHQVEVRGIQATSLSAMYDGQELTPDATLELEPMEVNTFRIKFH